MFNFKIIKKSTKSYARLGILQTDHGEVETPTLVGVATQATVKTLTAQMIAPTQTQMLICNTLHLHLRPGGKIVKKFGGVAKFMGWHGPTMTDSGGFQVFSLGFGRDLGMGKILKAKSDQKVISKQQPKLLKISEEGVEFRSYINGDKIFLSPKESMKIQANLGADIIFAFDECTSPVANRDYTIEAMHRTHRWAKVCIKEASSKQALYGIVQGGKFLDLRRESAQVIGAMDFPGFGIGGEFGDDKSEMVGMLKAVVENLPEAKPRHLLGIGHPEDILPIISSGMDTFDCTVPTHYARNGVAFTSKGRLDLVKSVFLEDKKPVDATCDCYTCLTHPRGYITHLLRSKEITAMTLLTIHNLTFFQNLVAKARLAIANNKI